MNDKNKSLVKKHKRIKRDIYTTTLDKMYIKLPKLKKPYQYYINHCGYLNIVKVENKKHIESFNCLHPGMLGYLREEVITFLVNATKNFRKGLKNE